MMFFEFLDSLNEAHSQVKGLVKASEVREIKATILDVIGGDFKVRDMLQGYGIVIECLAILNYPKPSDISQTYYENTKERAFMELLHEIHQNSQLNGGYCYE